MTRQLEEQAEKKSENILNLPEMENVTNFTEPDIMTQQDDIIDNVISILGSGLADGMREKDKGNPEQEVEKDTFPGIKVNLSDFNENKIIQTESPSKFFKDPLNPETEVLNIYLYNKTRHLYIYICSK